MKKKPLFVTLDAEGDNGWGRPRNITTLNAKGVERFQTFCERLNLKPIYLTTYEMAQDKTYIETLKKKNIDGLCEIGMHMHAWSTPPAYDLTGDDLQNLPFITEYPEEIIRKKVENITKHLENVFGIAPVSHRSGRWIVNQKYLEILAENGYKVDCSITPLINWECSIGDPSQRGGEDYSDCEAKPITKTLPCGHNIIEIPMTTSSNPVYDNLLVNTSLRLLNKSSWLFNGINSRKVVMMRPIARNARFLMSMIEKLSMREDVEHIEFMVHTSELYPNTCPHCKNESDLNHIYDLMEAMFSKLNKYCESITFREYIKDNRQ